MANTASQTGLWLIRNKEAPGGRPVLKAYRLPYPKEPWTIGYGFTKGVREGDTMTYEEAEARLLRDIKEYERKVLMNLTVEPNQNEFDAMLSLCWNCEVALTNPKSSLVLAHNRGDKVAAAKAFTLYDMASGQHNTSLLARRQEEAALYGKPVDGHEPMPQATGEPPKFTQSKINKAGIGGTVVAGAASIQPILDAVNAVKTSTDSLGTWLVPILAVGAIGFFGYMMWQRYQLRKNGQA